MAVNYNKMTVAQLKEELNQKGLDTSGKKADLVERLLAAGDQATPEADDANGDQEMAGEEDVNEDELLGDDTGEEEIIRTGDNTGEESQPEGQQPETQEETMEAEEQKDEAEVLAETGGEGDTGEQQTGEEGHMEHEGEEQHQDQGEEHHEEGQGDQACSKEDDTPPIVSVELREQLIAANPTVPRREDMKRDCLMEFKQRKVYAYPFLFDELQSETMVRALHKASSWSVRQYERPPKVKAAVAAVSEEPAKVEAKADADTDAGTQATEEKTNAEEKDQVKLEDAEQAEEQTEIHKDAQQAQQVEEEQDPEPHIKKFSIEIQYKTFDDAVEALNSIQTIKEGVTGKQMQYTDTDDVMREIRLPYQDDVSDRLLYVGNLPPDVLDHQVESLFSEARYVFVVRDHPNPDNGERKCKGYAFVEFRSPGQMRKAFDSAQEREDLVIGENKLAVINYSRNVLMDVSRDLLDDKERLNLARQLNAIRGKMNRARRGLVFVNEVEASKLQKRMQTLGKKLGADKRIRALLGYDTPPNPEMPQDQVNNRGGNRGGGRGGPRGGPRGGGGGWRGGRGGGPPSLMDMPNRNRWGGGGGQQSWGRGGAANYGGQYGAGYGSGGYGGWSSGGRGGYGQYGASYGAGYGTNYGSYGNQGYGGSGGWQQSSGGGRGRGGRGRY